jgi:hypothetical protein
VNHESRIRKLFPSIRRQRFKYFRAVVYLPPAAEPLLSKVKIQGLDALLTELQRMPDLGAPWASALLAYQALLLRHDGYCRRRYSRHR